MQLQSNYDVIVIGAGAAGLMCGIEAGKRGRKTVILDHAKKIGEKIRISGGGRCNFTNLNTSPQNFLSQNKHFCKSALKQYTQTDFIRLVEKHGIKYHEKTLGQLFCDDSAQQIIDMLLKECSQAGVQVIKETPVERIAKAENGFRLKTQNGIIKCESLIIATGGLSIPKIGASGFGYDVAKQFGHTVIETRAALVPLVFEDDMREYCRDLSGLSVNATVKYGKTEFSEGLLFTHRGLSGPSILQISSYWNEGQEIMVNLAKGRNALEDLKTAKQNSPKIEIQNALSDVLPKRLANAICNKSQITGRIADLPDKKLQSIAAQTNEWRVKPSGTEGYKTAEVTIGGVNTDELSSKTMESKFCSGLFFIGEVVDVTGHLGGYNFQWAWSSGYVAGQNA